VGVVGIVTAAALGGVVVVVVVVVVVMAAATTAAFACFRTGEVGGDRPLRVGAVDDA
jgi:hypothetical protein